MAEVTAGIQAHVNYVEDVNRWHLPTPPAWFLARLFDFDPDLMLVPSRTLIVGERPAYLLCRRRRRSAGFGDVAMLDNKHPYTNMCYTLGVVPIGPLRFKEGVNTFTQQGLVSLLDELRGRDNWRVTGGDLSKGEMLADMVEAQECKDEQAQRASFKDAIAHMARDAYRSLKARTGQRNKRASDYHGVARAPRPTKQPVILTDA